MLTRRRTPARAASAYSFEPLENRVLLATVPTGFRDLPFVGGVSNATSMSFAPDGRLFVTQQGGQLRVVTRNASGGGTLQTGPFLTVATDSVGERGLLSVTFDPDFMNNGYVYVYYTVPQTPRFNRVSRFKAMDADPGPGYRPGNFRDDGVPEFVVMNLDPLSGATNHNGGAMHFGADGKLYIAVGENATPSHSQTLSNRHGKMLRINSDGTIPTDNPFYNEATGANRAIWALGLRNPFTFEVQPGTGRIFINDVGSAGTGRREEINEGAPGANYGWPGIEGYRVSQPLPTIGTYRDPVFAYNPASVGGNAITGGTFYNPPVQNFPQQYVGKYFYSDLAGGFIDYIDPAVNRPPSLDFATGVSLPVDLDVGPDGGLYYLARGASAVGRIMHQSALVPRIVTQPRNVTVIEGEPAPFTVTAAGEGTLSYQWRRNGVNIDGATGPTYTLPVATDADNGARFSVVVSNTYGSVTSDEATLNVTLGPVRVIDLYVFYNDSFYDGDDPAANAADDAAIDSGKRVLLPGQLPSFANLTSYNKGINGLMVDVANLAPAATIGAGDFSFRVGTGDDVWAPAPPPSEVVTRRGAGAEGSDRVTILWPAGAIRDRWLEIMFLGNPAADAAPVYFGNLVGESGSGAPEAAFFVSPTDFGATRNAVGTVDVPVTNRFDHNKTGFVSPTDLAVTRSNIGRQLQTAFAEPIPGARPASALPLEDDDDLLA
jgi:glucose/arabinose dehydrogenase